MESIVYPIHYIKKAPLFKETLKITMEKEPNIEELLKEIDEDLSYYTKEIEELEELLKDPSLN
jgi:hypothetical protein